MRIEKEYGKYIIVCELCEELATSTKCETFQDALDYVKENNTCENCGG